MKLCQGKSIFFISYNDKIKSWKEDISKCKNFYELPMNAQKYIRRIEELVGVPIKWIGVGPSRESLIFID